MSPTAPSSLSHVSARVFLFNIFFLHLQAENGSYFLSRLSEKESMAKKEEPEGISISPQTPLKRPRKPLRFSWIFPAQSRYMDVSCTARVKPGTWMIRTACVGADAHIGPFVSCKFAAEFRKNGAFCRADVGIGPYYELTFFSVFVMMFMVLLTPRTFTMATAGLGSSWKGGGAHANYFSHRGIYGHDHRKTQKPSLWQVTVS